MHVRLRPRSASRARSPGVRVERCSFLGMIAAALAWPWFHRVPRPRPGWTREEQEVLEPARAVGEL